MDIKIKYFILIAIQIILVKSNFSSFDMTEYYKMPPLYQIDDYDRCLYETTDESIYCLVISEIVPNNSIPLWNQIKTFNSFDKIHYHHDKLINGVCINHCKDILGLPQNELNNYYAGKLTDLQLNTHINNLYSSQNDKRIKYNKLINQCINYNFTKNYNLKVRSNLEYCVSNKDTLQFDFLDVVFGLIIGLIIALTFASSYYDFKLKHKLTNDEEKKLHYKKPLSGKRQLAYLSFSLCRNYYRLIAPSKDHSDFSRDLRFFEAFRVFMMIGVLLNHSVLGLNAIGFTNPDLIETIYHSYFKTILTNGTLIMQTFFGMSGFLLTVIYTEQEKREKNRNFFGTFVKYVFLRFIRLTPMYGLAILFSATWYTKLNNGPFWMHGTETEKVFCRKYWWANLLYINNYVGTDQLCVAQAWYLAVDFQLFTLSVFLLLFMSRYPKAKYFVFIGGYLVSMLLIVIGFFKVDFQGIYLPTPEFLRYSVIFDTFFLKFFIPAHTNIGGYLSGILFAKIYINLKERNYKLGDNKKIIFCWYLSVAVGMVVIMSGELFYIFDVKEKSLLMGIYFAITKSIYGLICAFLFLGMCFKIGWIGYEFSSLPIFRIPGRLTYCAFLIHTFLIRLPAGESYQPIRITVMFLNLFVFGNIIMTYTISFFVTLILEFPISSIMKIILMGNEKRKPKMEEINTEEIPKVDDNFINVDA